MLVGDEARAVSFDFSPPVPDLAHLKARTGLSGKFSFEANGTDSIMSGDYSVTEQDALLARTTPEHKLRLVTLLQDMGQVVGMTGG